MTEKQLCERDAKRDLGADLLQSIREMNAGKGFRFETHGYVLTDLIDRAESKPAFNRVTGTKDSGGK